MSNFLIFIFYVKVLPGNSTEFHDLMFFNLHDVTEGVFRGFPPRRISNGYFFLYPFKKIKKWQIVITLLKYLILYFILVQQG